MSTNDQSSTSWLGGAGAGVMNRIIRGKKEVPVSEIEFEHGHETKGDDERDNS